MKLHVFAVRYKEPIEPFLNNFYSDEPVKKAMDDGYLKLTIINNYGILPQYPNVTILNNVTRPNFSTGHLSRNWNQCIINGFGENLNDPICDAILLLQIDSFLNNDWYKNLYKIPEDCYFLAVGRGDECMFIRPNAIKRVGLFDERFCNIGFQEGDYFLRCFIRIRENCCIFDSGHSRIHNPWPDIILYEDIIQDSRQINRDGISDYAEHARSAEFHSLSHRIFIMKWGHELRPDAWQMDVMNCIPPNLSNFKEFKYYPYFEKNIDPDIYVIS
jgi:hypothetical protein